jgi:hypothetical protein
MHQIVHDSHNQADQKQKEKRLSDPRRSACHTPEAKNSRDDG